MAELLRAHIDRGRRLIGQDAAVVALFTATLFLSALLLFSVQPVFAKMVLPKLGGTPAVWAVSMCFFQAALLAGYCYAHLLDRLVAPRIAPVVHLALLALAWLALPFGLPADTQPPPGDAYLWLIHVLAVGVGLPFFVVSANAPLLQAWFARTGHPQSADPYFLYAASNLGSLLALLSYPVAIEPNLGLAAQATLWTAGFVLLGLAIAASSFAMMAASDGWRPRPDIARDRGGVLATCAPAIGIRERLAWIGLAFVPSGLLVAFTTHVTTDIASAPLLWVLPLAAFLATFIIVFRDEPLVPDRLLDQAVAPLVTVALIALTTPMVGRNALFISGSVLAVLVVMLVAHRELYRLRPTAAGLTEFYIFMSLGGVLGGIFAAIVAPRVFTTVAEYPLLLVLGLCCRRGALGLWSATERQAALRTATIAIAVILAASVVASLWQSEADRIRALVLMLGLLPMLIWRAEVGRPMVLAAVLLLGLEVLPGSYPALSVERSFFGVHRVSRTADGQFHLVLHGTTIHGAERVRTPAGAPVERPVPATYYASGLPLADGFDLARAATGKTTGGLSVGIVGLGAGALACHVRPDESLRLFEIDPAVVRIARSPKFFRFLTVCQPEADLALGDARLTLGAEPAGSFDYLVIDAFSSDAVPVHLITREAIGMYLDRLTENGVLALHVSNQFMDLDTVASVTALSLAGSHAVAVRRMPPHRQAGDGGFDGSESWVVFVTRSAVTAARLAMIPDAIDAARPGVAPWTDDYSNIVGAILRRWRTSR